MRVSAATIPSSPLATTGMAWVKLMVEVTEGSSFVKTERPVVQHFQHQMAPDFCLRGMRRGGHEAAAERLVRSGKTSKAIDPTRRCFTISPVKPLAPLPLGAAATLAAV